MPNAECRVPNEDRQTRNRPRFFLSFGTRHSALGILAVLAVPLTGCFPKPNAANIALRKEVQSLQDKVSDLESRHTSEQAQLAALTKDRTIQTLPPEKLQRLFTTSKIVFKNIVIGQDLDPAKPGDEGFKIAITPVDQFGDEFKAAGSVGVELFDLADQTVRLGKWSLDTAQAQSKWMSTLVIDGYVMTFPWQTPPKNAKLLVKATFTDELTGGVFEATHELTVTPPAATQPSR